MVPRAVLHIVTRTLKLVSQVQHVVATEMDISVHFLVTSQNQNTDWLAARVVLVE